jgi:Spy/CpxP family protein refolding chaperone
MNHLTRHKVALYLAVIFLAGAVSGAVVGWNSAKQSRGPRHPVKDMCDFMKKKLRDRLALTPEQMTRIDPIVERTGQEMRAVHRKTTEEIEAIIQRSNAEIAKELTADQKAEFDKMEQERQEWLKKRSQDRKDPRPRR